MVENDEILERLFDNLTAKERKILELAEEGYSYAGIGDKLKYSKGTIKGDFHKLYLKFGVVIDFSGMNTNNKSTLLKAFREYNEVKQVSSE